MAITRKMMQLKGRLPAENWQIKIAIKQRRHRRLNTYHKIQPNQDDAV